MTYLRTCSMKYLLLFIIGFPSFVCGAEFDSKFEDLSEAIDNLELETSESSDDLEKKIRNLTDRLESYSQKSEDVRSLGTILQVELREIGSTKKDISIFRDEYQDQVGELSRIRADIENLKEKISDAKGKIISSADTVKWVSGIVSLVVIILGVFFSNRFLNLFADYKVMKERYDVVEKGYNSLLSRLDNILLERKREESNGREHME